MATPSMGFTPEDMKNISNVLGYTGEPSGFADYLSKNPQAHDSFMGIQKQRLQFDNGGFVATQHMANGGLVPLPSYGTPPTADQVDLSQVQAPQIGVETAQRLQQPALPAGGVYTAAQTPTEAAQSVAPSTALITGDVRVAEAGQAQAAQAIAPTATTAAAITAAQAAPDVRDVAAQTAAAQQLHLHKPLLQPSKQIPL